MGRFLDGEWGGLGSRSGCNFTQTWDLGQATSHFWNSVLSSVHWEDRKEFLCSHLVATVLLAHSHPSSSPFLLAFLHHWGWTRNTLHFPASPGARGSHVTWFCPVSLQGKPTGVSSKAFVFLIRWTDADALLLLPWSRKQEGKPLLWMQFLSIRKICLADKMDLSSESLQNYGRHDQTCAFKIWKPKLNTGPETREMGPQVLRPW